MNMVLLTFGLVALMLSTIALLMLLLVFDMEMLIINIKKVHRIITTIEVENDNSITSVELTKLSLDNIKHPLVITNITTNGNADDIKQVYDSVNKSRLGIADKLKGIARIINDSLDNYEFNVVTDDNSTNETNDDLLL